MHVPDGYLDAPTTITMAAGAALVVGQAFRHARTEQRPDRAAGMLGLVAAFIFAAQMLNFPVASGTSGHLMGGVLAAVLLGPATAVLCITLVLAVQALLFADGGLAALGTNVVLMAGVGIVVGWLAFRGIRAVLPARAASVPVAAAGAALVSVPASALAFAVLYAVGGHHDVGLVELATSMVGWHLLIGLGEAVVTGLAVAAVLALRPDQVHGAAPLRAYDGTAPVLHGAAS